MDPYILVKFNGKELNKTEVAIDQAKHAVFGEMFTLQNVSMAVKAEGTLDLLAYDADSVTSDLLGTARPIDIKELCIYFGKVKRKVDLFDASQKVIGNILIETNLIWQEEKVSQNFDHKSYLSITVQFAEFEWSGEYFKKQDPYIKFQY